VKASIRIFIDNRTYYGWVLAEYRYIFKGGICKTYGYHNNFSPGCGRKVSMTRERREHFRGSSRDEKEESGPDEDIVRSMRNLPILQTLPGSQGEIYISEPVFVNVY
jgi:hypothetical protein